MELKKDIEPLKAIAIAAIVNGDPEKEKSLLAVSAAMIERHHLKYKIAFDWWAKLYGLSTYINAVEYNRLVSGLNFHEKKEILRFTKTSVLLLDDPAPKKIYTV